MYIGSTKKLGAKNPINFFSLLQHILRSPLKWHFWIVAKMRHLGLTRKTFMGLVSHTCLHYPSCLSSLWDVCRVAPPKRMNFRKIAKIYIADFWPLNGAFLIWNWKQFATWLSEMKEGRQRLFGSFSIIHPFWREGPPNSPVMYFLLMMGLSLYRKKCKSPHLNLKKKTGDWHCFRTLWCFLPRFQKAAADEKVASLSKNYQLSKCPKISSK